MGASISGKSVDKTKGNFLAPGIQFKEAELLRVLNFCRK